MGYYLISQCDRTVVVAPLMNAAIDFRLFLPFAAGGPLQYAAGGSTQRSNSEPDHEHTEG